MRCRRKDRKGGRNKVSLKKLQQHTCTKQTYRINCFIFNNHLRKSSKTMMRNKVRFVHPTEARVSDEALSSLKFRWRSGKAGLGSMCLGPPILCSQFPTATSPWQSASTSALSRCTICVHRIEKIVCAQEKRYGKMKIGYQWLCIFLKLFPFFILSTVKTQATVVISNWGQ